MYNVNCRNLKLIVRRNSCDISKMRIIVVIFTYKCKKKLQFKTVCNGNTAYITQLKQQKSRNHATTNLVRVRVMVRVSVSR